MVSLAETSISGAAIGAHDSATIANFFAKEKDVLKQEITKKDDQIDELKLKVYRLENEVSALKQDIKSTAPKRKTSKSSNHDEPAELPSLIDTVYGKKENNTGNGNVSTATPPNVSTETKKKVNVKKKKTGVKRGSVASNGLKSNSRVSVTSTTTPAVVVPNPTSVCTKCSSLGVLSEQFPKIKLKTYVNCKNKFELADVNGDGTVDSEELSTILESAGLFFTSSQIQDILSKVDNDDDIALDFVEVLQVVSTLEENPNRRADLPKSLKDNQSKVCSVM
ncbi:uncharacterized protein LOC134824236 [Bolinopsis microptera]|uniref:uncharacterized protein LOC134824236 n=1 Tax=Bolinopsis microptera TaxID=2820187 RepID=UPI0030791961